MSKFKSIKKYAVIVAIVILPLVYSFFYLDAFWDPYSKLEDLPVAVVNQDKGATLDNEQRNVGKEIVDELKDDKTLDWVITDAKDAKDGLNNRRYYAQIIIPENFSSNIATVDSSSSNKLKGIIIYEPNEKRNYLAGQVLNRVILELKDKVSSKITREIVDEITNQSKGIPQDLGTLNDGLTKLYDGSDKLVTGLSDLYNNQAKYNDGVLSLKKGAVSALSGSKSLNSGAAQLSDGLKLFASKLTEGAPVTTALLDGSAKFKTGLNSFADGTKQVSDGIAKLGKGSSQLSQGSKQYNQSIISFDKSLVQVLDGTTASVNAGKQLGSLFSTYIKQNPSAMSDPSIKAIYQILTQSQSTSDTLLAGTAALKTASAKLVEGYNQINTGITGLNQNIGILDSGAQKFAAGSTNLNANYEQLDGGINKLASGISSAAINAAALSTGAEKLRTGISQLNSGVGKISSGADQLYTNAQKFSDGESTLKDGATKLKEGISTAKDGVANSIETANNKLQKTDGISDFASNPIEIKQNNVNPVPDYGTAFAPYFISLSLWVGALLMFFSVYMDPEVRFRQGKNRSKLFKYFGYAMLGVVQAVVLCLVLKNGLHLLVKNTAIFYMVAIVISLSFIGVMQFLIVNLNKVGQFLAILLLILQLTSCGGTFPMELVPKFFRVINPLMPMTYSVNALKESISGIDYGFMYQNLAVLGGIMVVFLTASLLISRYKDKKSDTKLKSKNGVNLDNEEAEVFL